MTEREEEGRRGCGRQDRKRREDGTRDRQEHEDQPVRARRKRQARNVVRRGGWALVCRRRGGRPAGGQPCPGRGARVDGSPLSPIVRSPPDPFLAPLSVSRRATLSARGEECRIACTGCDGVSLSAPGVSARGERRRQHDEHGSLAVPSVPRGCRRCAHETPPCRTTGGCCRGQVQASWRGEGGGGDSEGRRGVDVVQVRAAGCATGCGLNERARRGRDGGR